MTFQELEQIFNRAARLSFSKKKFLLVCPVLLLCGVLIVLFRALSYGVGAWIGMSLAFLPAFLCSGVLLAVGVLLTRIYYHEIKGHTFRLGKILLHSLQLLIGISYLSLPLLLAYLCLWTFMGVFHLLRAIPGVGEALGVLLAFGPFLLVLGSLLLGFISLLMLFFVTPHVALKNHVHVQIAEEIWGRLVRSIFANSLLLAIGIFPLLLCVGFLIAAAILTGVNYITPESTLGSVLQWFFIMVPFSILMTPSIIFFFNFATEGYALMQKKEVFRSDREKQGEGCATPL